MRTNISFEFSNPYAKEMTATWRIPEGYGDEQQEKALMLWASYLVKAFDLYKQGQYVEALGVGFDALGNLVSLCNHDESFFYSSKGDKRYAAELTDVTLYVICKTYSAKELPAEAKQEVQTRLDACHNIYKKATSQGCFADYNVEEIISNYRSEPYAEIFDSFFNLASGNSGEEEKELTQEEQNSLTKKVAEEVLSIKGYASLSSEEIELLSYILTNIYLQEILFHDGLASEAQLEERIDELSDVVSERIQKATALHEKAMLFNAAFDLSRADAEIADYKERVSLFVSEVMSAPNVAYPILHAAIDALQNEPLTQVIWDSKGRRSQFSIGEDFFETTLQRWATTQNADGSWPNVSADEAYGRISVIGHDYGSVKGVDNRYVTDIAYGFYSQTPCNTPKQLHAQFTAYKSKWGNNRNDKSFKVQAMQLLHANPLPLADCLRLLYILCP